MTTHAPRSQIPVMNSAPASPSAAGFPALSSNSAEAAAPSSNIPSYARATKASLPSSPSSVTAVSTGPSAREKKVSPLSAPSSPYARPPVLKPKKVVAKGVVPGAAPAPKITTAKKTSTTAKAPAKKGASGPSVPAKKEVPAVKTSSLSALAPSFTFNQPLPASSTSSRAREKSQSPPLESLSPHAPSFEPTSSAPASPPLLDETPPIGVTEQNDSPPPSRADSVSTHATGLGIEQAPLELTAVPSPSLEELELKVEDPLEEGQIAEEEEPFSVQTDSNLVETRLEEELAALPEDSGESETEAKHEEVEAVLDEAPVRVEEAAPELATKSGTLEGEAEVELDEELGSSEEQAAGLPLAEPEVAKDVAQQDIGNEANESDVSTPINAEITATSDTLAEDSLAETAEEVVIPTTLEETLPLLATIATAVDISEDEPSNLVEDVEIPTSAEEVVRLPNLDETLDVEELEIPLPPEAREDFEASPIEPIVDAEEESVVDAEEKPVDGAEEESEAATEEKAVERKSPEWTPFEDPIEEPSQLAPVEIQSNAVPTDADTSPSIPMPPASDSTSDPKVSSSTPFTTQIEKSLADSTPSASKPALRRRRSSSPPRPPHEQSKDASEAPSLTLAIRSAWHSTTWRQRIPAVIASVAINFGLPFINGVMLGFGELFARNFIGVKLGWGAPFTAPSASNAGRANTASVGLRNTSGPLAPGDKGSAGGRTAAGLAFRELEEQL